MMPQTRNPSCTVTVGLRAAVLWRFVGASAAFNSLTFTVLVSETVIMQTPWSEVQSIAARMNNFIPKDF